jgi:hypothetical protein
MDTHASAPSRLTPLLVALCVVVAAVGVVWPAWDMFGPERRPMLQGWDDSFYYFWLPSVVIDGDLDFTNQLEQASTLHTGVRDDALSAPRTDTGFVLNKYPPGWALGSLPFFLLAHAFAPAGSTGFEPIYLLSVWLGQLLYAVAGLWLACRIVARFFPATAAPATLVVWLASPLVYYQTARLSMSHSQVFVLALLVFWSALRIRDSDAPTRLWALLGFAAALLVVTRNVALIYLAMPAVVVAPRLRSFRSAAALLAGAFLPAALQLLAWRILFGSWIAYTYGGERFDFSDLHLLEVLFSPRHGWFYWHPLFLPAIAAFTAWALRRAEGLAWLASLVVIVLLNAAWPTWWLGSSFGYRGFEVPTLFAMIGFASLLAAASSHPRLRSLLTAAALLAVVWNLALFALFLTQRIPRQDPVTYLDAARALVHWFAP